MESKVTECFRGSRNLTLTRIANAAYGDGGKGTYMIGLLRKYQGGTETSKQCGTVEIPPIDTPFLGMHFKNGISWNNIGNRVGPVAVVGFRACFSSLLYSSSKVGIDG